MNLGRGRQNRHWLVAWAASLDPGARVALSARQTWGHAGKIVNPTSLMGGGTEPGMRDQHQGCLWGQADLGSHSRPSWLCHLGELLDLSVPQFTHASEGQVRVK